MNEDYREQNQTDEEDVEQETPIESPFSRAFMVLVAPRRTFESLAAKSTRMDWLLPILITIIVALLIINTGWDYIRTEQINQSIDRIEHSSSLSDSQKDAQIAQIRQSADNLGTVSLVVANIASLVGIFASTAVIALVLMGIARLLLGASLTFDSGFKITALSGMVSAAGTLVELPLLHLFESLERSRLTLGHLLPSGMADSFIYQLVNIDIFTILYTVFLAIGLAVFTRKPLARTVTPLIVLWIGFRVVAVSIAAMVGGIGA